MSNEDDLTRSRKYEVFDANDVAKLFSEYKKEYEKRFSHEKPDGKNGKYYKTSYSLENPQQFRYIEKDWGNANNGSYLSFINEISSGRLPNFIAYKSSQEPWEKVEVDQRISHNQIDRISQQYQDIADKLACRNCINGCTAGCKDECGAKCSTGACKNSCARACKEKSSCSGICGSNECQNGCRGNASTGPEYGSCTVGCNGACKTTCSGSSCKSTCSTGKCGDYCQGGCGAATINCTGKCGGGSNGCVGTAGK